MAKRDEIKVLAFWAGAIYYGALAITGGTLLFFVAQDLF